MIDAKKVQNAQKVFNTLCAMMDEKKLKYEKHEEDFVIDFIMGGDDLPMQMIVNVDAERQLIRLLSVIPVTFPKEKRTEAAVAACLATDKLAVGSFDFDYKKGTVYFRLNSSYIDSLISKDLFVYMVGVSTNTVDEYNDKFFLLAKGKITLEEFF